MNTLSSSDISHLGRLSRLDLTAEEQERFAGQLTSVVGYVEQLSAVNTESIGQITGVTGLANVMGDDVPRDASDLCAVPSADLLAGAPAHEDNLFVVRAVLGEEAPGA